VRPYAVYCKQFVPCTSKRCGLLTGRTPTLLNAQFLDDYLDMHAPSVPLVDLVHVGETFEAIRDGEWNKALREDIIYLFRVSVQGEQAMLKVGKAQCAIFHYKVRSQPCTGNTKYCILQEGCDSRL